MSVDEYIASQPAAAQKVLRRVRSIIRKAVPAAEETISYRIPTYKLHGRAVVYFAGFTQHFSLYPSTSYVLAALGDDARRHVVSKGTFRFPLSEPIPVTLIRGIARCRAREVAELEKAKAAAPGARGARHPAGRSRSRERPRRSP
jgi:uncharacterized protein YdhG (YjbR/CyaY superfamily)